MPALVLVAKQRCFCSYSLFSSSFMLAVCPAAALTAKAATTAIDNKRRRRWLCHRLSLSLSLHLCDISRFVLWMATTTKKPAKANDQKTQDTFLYMQNIQERKSECGVGGMKQNQVKYTKIKWQKSKVLLLYSLSPSLSFSLSLASSYSPSLSGCLCSSTRHDDSQFHSFMIHESASSRFHIFCFCCWEFQTTTSSNKVPKKILRLCFLWRFIYTLN